MKNQIINRIQRWLQPETKPQTQPEHLLIVEDEQPLSNLYLRFFKRRGFRVTVAESLAEAESKLTANSFDLVLQDVMLPDGDGFEFVPRIKELHPAVPVIILTGLGYDEAVLQDALQSGATSYLSKFQPLDQALVEIRSVLKFAKPHTPAAPSEDNYSAIEPSLPAPPALDAYSTREAALCHVLVSVC
jgi:two-component system, NtrC family, response regulator HydG